MPDETPEPAQSAMPPDPFVADAFWSAIATEFRGLRSAGLNLAEAAVLTAAHLAVNRAVTQADQLPGEQPQAS